MAYNKKVKPKKKRQAVLTKPIHLPGLPQIPTVSALRADLPPIVQGKKGSVVKLQPKQITEVPAYLLAQFPLMTLPEARIFLAFEKRGKKLNVDFLYQDPSLGGRQTPGGTVIDFVYIGTWPWIMLPVNGNYWHYQRGFKIIEHDLLILRRLREAGYSVVVMDENDIEERTAVVVLHLAIDLLVDISELAGKY